MSEISFCKNDINIIMTQTNYTEEQARAKMQVFNGDYMQVIRDYMGISVKKEEKKVKSVNQEIFRQIRTKMDMKEYRDKHPIDMNQVIENLTESDEREKLRGHSTRPN